MTLLIATPYEQAKSQLDKINAAFNEATNVMPPIYAPDLIGVKCEDGSEMFKLIVDDALLEEAKSDLLGHVGKHHYQELIAIDILDHRKDGGTESTTKANQREMLLASLIEGKQERSILLFV